jgi:hypothetical protein
VGTANDNAVAESFFNLLKRERIPRKAYRIRAEARQDVFDDIEMFYNPMRRHVRDEMLSPVEFERQLKATPKASRKLRAIQFGGRSRDQKRSLRTLCTLSYEVVRSLSL